MACTPVPPVRRPLHGRHLRGFSLPEATTACAIALMTALAAVPNWRDFVQLRQLDAAAAAVGHQLRLGREAAHRLQAPVRLDMVTTTQGTCLILHAGSPGDCPCQASSVCRSGQVPLRRLEWTDASVRVVGNVAGVTWNPVTGTATPTATIRLTLPDGRGVQQVLNIAGRVRSCSPDARVPGHAPC